MGDDGERIDLPDETGNLLLDFPLAVHGQCHNDGRYENEAEHSGGDLRVAQPIRRIDALLVAVAARWLDGRRLPRHPRYTLSEREFLTNETQASIIRNSFSFFCCLPPSYRCRVVGRVIEFANGNHLVVAVEAGRFFSVYQQTGDVAELDGEDGVVAFGVAIVINLNGRPRYTWPIQIIEKF